MTNINFNLNILLKLVMRKSKSRGYTWLPYFNKKMYMALNVKKMYLFNVMENTFHVSNINHIKILKYVHNYIMDY